LRFFSSPTATTILYSKDWFLLTIDRHVSIEKNKISWLDLGLFFFFVSSIFSVLLQLNSENINRWQLNISTSIFCMLPTSRLSKHSNLVKWEEQRANSCYLLVALIISYLSFLYGFLLRGKCIHSHTYHSNKIWSKINLSISLLKNKTDFFFKWILY
jgi:hypothetical protein